MTVVGIDPGIKGGIAILGDEPIAFPMPIVGKEIDAGAIARLFAHHAVSLVVVEKAQSMPKQGVTGVFSYGAGYGKILGALEAVAVPYETVRPTAWKKAVLAGTSKDKEAAINYVRCRYPTIDLMPGNKRTPHDGIADAVCIAEYAKGRL